MRTGIALLVLTASACSRAIDAADGPPDLARPSDRRERCNGVDDDGDGRIDEGCPIRLTRDPGNDTAPSASNGRVAWVRGAQLAPEPPALWGRMLSGGEERLLAAGVQPPFALSGAWMPSVSGGRVAVRLARPANAYAVIDLETGEHDLRMPPPAKAYLGCALSGRYLAWGQEPTLGTTDIYVVDLAGGEPRLVATAAGEVTPRFDGARLFWSSRDGNVFWTDVTDGGAPRRVGARPPRSNYPTHVGGGALVMLELDSGAQNCQVALYDLSDGSRSELGPLLPLRRCDVPMAVSARWVVVERDPGGASDLWLLDRRTGRWWQATDYPRRSTDAVLDGDLLIWSDDRNGSGDLYAMDLSDFDQGDFFPEGRAP